MGVFNLVALALFAVGSFAGHNIPKPTNHDSLIGGKKWVVLVASSASWSNYRHQADICHAYQIVKSNGIPEENIITMMMDDIAYNSRNPTPGKIINQPNGTDVYQGVVIDYKGKDVNKSNFLKIITGDIEGMRSIGTGKVVKGGRLDKIFINFIGYAATGMLCFTNDNACLKADELNDTFNYMHGNGTYKKMLLYFDANFVGSMFDGILSENTNILAITATGPRESTNACYCGSQSGPYKTCLGDLFGVTWMEDLDVPRSSKSARRRSIFNDYRVVRTNVTRSNVMIYGDFDTGKEKLSSFIGYHGNDEEDSRAVLSNEIDIKTTVSSRDVHESEVQYQLANDKLSLPETIKLSAELHKNNKMRSVIDSAIQKIYSDVVKARLDIKSEIGDYDEPNHLKLTLSMFPCYRSILNQITENCFSLTKNPYVLNKLTIFANMCVVDDQIHEMVGNIIVKSCSKIPNNIINVQ